MAWQRLGQPVHIMWRDEHLPQYDEKHSVQVVKMHGSVDDTDMVLTAVDYDNYAERRPLIYQFVSTLFVTRTILFLGCSLADPNVVALLDRISTASAKGGRPHYAVLHEPQPEDISRLASYGIQTIALGRRDREAALVDWLDRLRAASADTGETNLERAIMFNKAVDDLIRYGYPGDLLRMRASFGIISNPRAGSVASQVYEGLEQQAQEFALGERTRLFLQKDHRNRVRQIVHIDPFASLDKGYTKEAVHIRLTAMLDFLQEFPTQIELSHSPIPIETNQLIVGERETISAYKYRQVGFTNAASACNRWVVRRDARIFDRDFYAIRQLNRTMATRLGIDTDSPIWPTDLSTRIIEAAISSLRRPGAELVLVDGNPPLLSERSVAPDIGRQRVIHLHLVTSEQPRHVLLQQRPIRKSQYGGLIDVAVAGHQRTSDARLEAVREAAEELGIWLDQQDLVTVDTFEQTADGVPEIVSVFVAHIPKLIDVMTNGGTSNEVTRLLMVPLDDLVDRGNAVAQTYEQVGELRVPSEQLVDQIHLTPGLTERLAMVRAAID